MGDLPEAMLTKGRVPDDVFLADERLYRRVPLHLWDDGEDDIDIDAIQLPDMSVVRSKYAHPEWARLDRDEYALWGVISFAVEGIPEKMTHLGVFEWCFKPCHDPLKRNYPHSEVRGFENGVHVNTQLSDRITPDLHLRWRDRLLRNVKKVIRPYEEFETRQDPP